MSRRMLAMAALVALAVAACGDTGTTTTAPATTLPTTTTRPATTLPSATTSEPPSTAATTTTSPPPTTTVAPATTAGDGTVRVEVVVEQGSVVGGASTAEVDLDASVQITVTADVADEIHVHGYDVFADVAPGEPAVVELTATIPGIFEVELEGARLLLLELEVS